MNILIGSNNKHKAAEIQEIFDRVAPGKVKIMIPAEVLNEKLDIIEDGDTLEANAYLKARGFYDATGIACIADDTGLEIDALSGNPGVHSARFAGEESNDQKNRTKVLKMMAPVDQKERSARFRTVICYCEADEVWYVDGICEGSIIETERGDSGFGYDPIFIPDGYDVTFAEMTAEQKNKISHRGKAIENLISELKRRKII
jgi:XTP/dITP diphosphohydrolase